MSVYRVTYLHCMLLPVKINYIELTFCDSSDDGVEIIVDAVTMGTGIP